MTHILLCCSFFSQLTVFKLKLQQVVDLQTSSDTWTDTHLHPAEQYFLFFL